MIYFKKSTRSGPHDDNCVEVSADWKMSSFSTGNAQCVEISFPLADDEKIFKGDEPVLVHVRDSKDPEGGTLFFTGAEWEAFIAGVKDGEFDL